ncbi:MAG: phytoene desaturase family protein, partial [Acidobacteria bacterium]|nr:phytoene desaturase family protein [Acidobacteriota bacterium]
VKGGLSQISLAMAKAIEELGGKIYRDTKVKEIIVENGCAKGVKTESNEPFYSDEVIVNADFGYAATNLFPKNSLKKYSEKKLQKKLYSCSTFMLYLGLDKSYSLPHHNIIFSKNYKKYINEIAEHKEVTDDISIYLRNASISDETIAPKGMSNIYILVPVANLKSNIDWNRKNEFRNLVIKTIEEKLQLKDFEKHIVFEKQLTPKDWEQKYNVYLGATFNLGHNLMQMLYFRPHNKFEEVDNCYLVGGGTHPGSGLPTIYESGRITANWISKKYKVKFVSKNLQVK